MGFRLFGVVFMIIWVMLAIFIFGLFIAVIVSHLKREVKNNNSPRITAEVKAVAKRMSFRRNSSANGYGTLSRSYYYTTFELENGDRMELMLSGEEYGLIAEGDTGKLTFQGTRFLSFDRNIGKA